MLLTGACKNVAAEVPHKLTNQRLFVLDAARGIALLLVCTAHFFDVYVDAMQEESVLATYFHALTKIATPSFVLVSSILLGYFSIIRHQDFAQLRLHILDRALFLVTAGHILTAASYATKSGMFVAMTHGYVTDTLGFCTIMSLLVLRYIKGSSIRLLLGIMLYLIGWSGWNLWHPDSPLLIALRGIFLGPDENGRAIFGFPLLPWLGVYLIGTCVGDWFGTFERSKLPLAGKTLASLSCIVLGAVVFVKTFLFSLQISRSIYLPWASYSKYPPGPFYLLTYGSAALLIIGGLLWVSKASQTSALLNVVERLGRNSLSLFIIQSYLYFTVFYFLLGHMHVSTFHVEILLLISSLFCIVWLSRVFDVIKLNRAWTIGLPALVRNWPIPSDAGGQLSPKMFSKFMSLGYEPSGTPKK